MIHFRPILTALLSAILLALLFTACLHVTVGHAQNPDMQQENVQLTGAAKSGFSPRQSLPVRSHRWLDVVEEEVTEEEEFTHGGRHSSTHGYTAVTHAALRHSCRNLIAILSAVRTRGQIADSAIDHSPVVLRL